jgi:1-acyl-sn-glycerol-3-phosphate acyltransferase
MPVIRFWEIRSGHGDWKRETPMKLAKDTVDTVDSEGGSLVNDTTRRRPQDPDALLLTSRLHFREAAEFIGRNIARVEKAFTGKYAARNWMLVSLLAAPPISFVFIALRPNPRQIWAQRWPTIAFVGLYQIALDRCVEIEGLGHLPETGPVILAGNHINKTALDGMLLGSKILINRGVPTKFVSVADPATRMLKHFVRVMGTTEGVLLPISKGMTTDTMIQFLRNPEAFQRRQPILGIFPVGEADAYFETHIDKAWHTSAAVAATETGAPIVPFFIEGLPYHWGPFDMLKAVARSLVGENPFKFKIRLGPPIRAEVVKDERDYKDMTERVRQAVKSLAN